MSEAFVVCVGDELVRGEVSDLHGRFLSSFLRKRGISTARISAIGDDPADLLAELSAITARAELVIVTGGLGPTSDDRTRDALGMLVGKAPEFDQSLWDQIQRDTGRSLSGSNRRQAYLPLGFRPLQNRAGTAPGLVGEINQCRVVALPGPPRELASMVEDHAEIIVGDLGGPEPESDTVSCFGIPESRLEDALNAVVSGDRAAKNIDWHTRAGGGRIVLRLLGGDVKTRRRILSDLEREFGSERFASGVTMLASELVDELTRRKLTISAAESCTGGLLGAALTRVPGSSRVFWGSIVTYANEAKERMLGVPEQMLARHGAVSEEVAIRMATAARELSGSNCSVGITGIAGPDGGSPAKPVGTVWIALSADSGERAKCFEFSGGRERIRRWAETEALLMLRAWVSLLDR